MKKALTLVIAMLIFSSCAPPGTGGESSGSAITSFIPFILIFVLFYLLILRPQQKQNRERQNMLKNVKRGDKILSSGGIYGKVVNVSDNELSVEIAKGINIQMSRSGVSAIIKQEKDSSKNKGESDKK